MSDELLSGELGRFAGVEVVPHMPKGWALIGSFPTVYEPEERPACPECGRPWQPLGLGHDRGCKLGAFIWGEILAMQVRSPTSMVLVTGIV